MARGAVGRRASPFSRAPATVARRPPAAAHRHRPRPPAPPIATAALLEVEVAANTVSAWAAAELLARRLAEERFADPAEYAASVRRDQGAALPRPRQAHARVPRRRHLRRPRTDRLRPRAAPGITAQGGSDLSDRNDGTLATCTDKEIPNGLAHRPESVAERPRRGSAGVRHGSQAKLWAIRGTVI